MAGLAVATLALWLAPGCPGTNGLSEGDPTSADDEGAAQSEGPSAGPRTLEKGNVEDWPDGWLVVRQEEWIPVVDGLGQSLHAARDDFQNGDREAAEAQIRRGITLLEGQLSGASARDRQAIASAISTLRTFADRLAGDTEVTVEQLDIAFANAYRFNLEREGLVVEQSTSQPYLDRPEAHLRRAIERFLDDEPEEAAREIDRASAYLRVEANRREAAERAQLVDAAQELEHVAARVRVLEIRDRTELSRVFDPVLRQWRQLAQAPVRARSLGLMHQ
jgi:hypothetical protein